MSSKKKKRQVVSSDEDDGVQDANVTQGKPRTSQRLKGKSQRRSFVLPSRDKIWNAIPSLSDPKSLKSISPKKTVNNFTKVYNTYNYDYYEDTSSDDSEDFITDTEENASSGEQKKSSRIKNRKRRIKVSSSSEEENEVNNNNDCDPSQGESKMKVKDTGHTSHGESTLSGIGSSCVDNGLDDFIDCPQDSCNPDSDSNSDDEKISPMKRRRNTSLLDSDGESDGSDCFGNDVSACDENQVDVESRASKFKKKKDELFQKFKDVQEQRKACKKT